MPDGQNECEDCGQSFPLREATGICPKCTKLRPLAHGSPEYQDISRWPQCSSCGTTRRNMVPPPPGSTIQTCGAASCNLAITLVQPTGTAPLGSSHSINTQEAHIIRTSALRERLKLSAAGNGSRNNSSGTQLTTTTLLQHEHGGGLPGDAKTMVCWQVRRAKAKTSYIDANLGSSSKKWSNSLFLNDIKADIVQTINIEWTKKTPIPLDDEAVSFRWSGGRLLERDTSGMTLGEFYAYHSTPSNSSIYLQNIPGDKSGSENRGTDDESEFSTQPHSAAVSTTGHSRKRGRTESSTSLTGSVAKQSRLIVPHSEFSLSTRRGMVVQKRSEMTFKKINCIITIATGECSLVNTGEVHRGYILDKPFASGRMKHAYDFQLTNDEQSYVAKRFYKLNKYDDDDSVPVNKNKFLNCFYRFCKTYKDSVSVDLNIAFADAFLALEVDRPSTASGVPIITDEDEGLTWLIERKRPSTVIKFSGTLNHRSARRDMRSATISALAHFVFGYSKHELVFADLQGTPCQLQTRDGVGKDGLVLFDLMTHTRAGDSGVGDFGEEGIETFVKDHKCNEICHGLVLHEAYPLVMEENGQEDGEDGQKDGEDGQEDGEDGTKDNNDKEENNGDDELPERPIQVHD
ncbi:kinase-like domain-containing protein [Mycena epipterygia]|nr:kinase-like domain-containing protein [Mycena epipterygia]